MESLCPKPKTLARSASPEETHSSQGSQLAGGEVRVDAGEDKIGPFFLELPPERAGLAPLRRIDPRAMAQIGIENGPRLPGHARVRNAHQQFVVDPQAPNVEVGRAGIDDVVEDEQFGVENL